MEKRGLTWLISVNHAVINITLGSTFLTQGFCRNKSWYSRSVSHSLMQSNKAWDLKGKIRNQSEFSCKQTYFIFIFIGSLSQRFWMTAMFFLKLIVGRINTSTDDSSFWVYLTASMSSTLKSKQQLVSEHFSDLISSSKLSVDRVMTLVFSFTNTKYSYFHSLRLYIYQVFFTQNPAK